MGCKQTAQCKVSKKKVITVDRVFEQVAWQRDLGRRRCLGSHREQTTEETDIMEKRHRTKRKREANGPTKGDWAEAQFR